MWFCDNDIISGHENSLKCLSYLRASKCQNLVIVAPLFSTHTILRVTQSCVIASLTVAKSNDTRILKEIVAEQ